MDTITTTPTEEPVASEQRGVGSVLIVGGGVAGTMLARELRQQDYAGEITLVCPEGMPHDRPPLTKDYLAGRAQDADVALCEDGWYEGHHVRLVADRVTGIELGGSRPTVTLGSGEQLDADLVVLATGLVPRRPVPGSDLPGVYTIHTLAEAREVRERLGKGHRLVVIGGGLIGAEAAVTASREADVTMVSRTDAPLDGAFGPTMARWLHEHVAAAGVRTLVGDVAGIDAADDALVVRVGTDPVPADTVLIALGSEPDLELARSAGLDIDVRVVVDAGQRTSNPRVLAVGDLAAPLGERHWRSALASAMRAASTILGEPLPDSPIPWFWTDRADLHVEVVGSMVGAREVVREGDGRPVAVFGVARSGVLMGAVTLDNPRLARQARKLIESGRSVPDGVLADPTQDLRKLPEVESIAPVDEVRPVVEAAASPGDAEWQDLWGRALEQAGDAVIVIDREGLVRGWNEKAEDVFGHKRADILGHNIEVIIPPKLRSAHEMGFGAAMETGHLASDGRARLTKGIRGDGGSVYVEMTFAVINGDDGSAIGSVAVARQVPKPSR
ncbi:FAD-dependent oxidoreductase [Aestuariimicrobium sp. p3-SID1156]|uniref:FAD-dependent oxidoreductase n=1 Tax=Aestuariimicrobium sp. p3-SID1156 TaxID=2916038 RepID=UPI00223B96EB|nr:FAD-dependent oxidoreductase [Aestuariimicrobium sp. p3-SID1156]MCT1457977.1 FAD-dependent oxidoreductase [Aestuariimicrobium sp. p3-SID1156]